MKIRAHAAMSAKGGLEPFGFDLGQLGPHQSDVRVTHRNVSTRMRQVVFAFIEQLRKSSPGFGAMTG